MSKLPDFLLPAAADMVRMCRAAGEGTRLPDIRDSLAKAHPDVSPSDIQAVMRHVATSMLQHAER